MKVFDIAIIGAGPAGIMAAITAAKNRSRVVLIEKNNQIGRKILATGNGRCNITNKNITIDRFHGANKEFISTIIERFDQNKTINFFESLGLILKEEDNGRMFPRTNQASTVVNALDFELKRLNVEVMLDSPVRKITKIDFWEINVQNKPVITAKKLILTTGGKAAFQLGSSGDGIFWAKQLGHEVKPIYAALVPVETNEKWTREVQGIKVEGNVCVYTKNKKIAEKPGDILFTHYGVSGPAIMALSHLIAPYINNEEMILKIDLYPEIEHNELDKKIAVIFSSAGAKNVKNSLNGVIPNNLIPIILQLSNISDTKKAAEISKIERRKIVENIKSITLTVNKLRPLKEAQVSMGGVCEGQIDPISLQSRIASDLYFAGEIIDVHADSGGFNLQWAWSSGYVAGLSTSKTI